jgi:hypothetical protein
LSQGMKENGAHTRSDRQRVQGQEPSSIGSSSLSCEGRRASEGDTTVSPRKLLFSSRLEQLRFSAVKRRFILILILGPLVYMLRWQRQWQPRDFNLFPLVEDSQFEDTQSENFPVRKPVSTAPYSQHMKPDTAANYSRVAAVKDAATGRYLDKKMTRPRAKQKKQPFSVTYYTYARPDRVGACLQDMLQGHAYAWHQKTTYGGACINHTTHPERHKSVQEMIEALGLSSELRFACPPPGQESTSDFPQLNDTHFILPTALYRRKDAKTFNPRWLAFMRKKVRKAWNDHHGTKGGATHKTPSEAAQLAVHIRRGDVEPCNKNSKRFLPNSHYIDLIRKYLCEKKNSLPAESKVNITIFSEKNAGIEGWDDLRNALEEHKALATYNFALDTDIIDTFRRLVSADAIILSLSSFSLTGAVLNFKQDKPSPFNEIVYTPFWHAPLNSWTAVSHAQLIKTQREIQRLAQVSGCSSDTPITAWVGRGPLRKRPPTKRECD